MLQLANPNPQTSNSGRSDSSFMPQLDFLAIARIFYRQWPLIAGCMGLMLVLGGIYMLTAKPRYTTSFSILVDVRQKSLMSRQDSAADRVVDPGLVESQVEILKSDSTALSVVRDLKLTEDPEFMGGGGGLLSQLFGLFRGSAPPSKEDLERSAIDRLTSGIKAKRVGATYVIEVAYTGSEPQRTVAIANALADAYSVGELEARYQATKRASRWLQDRSKELRDQAATADLAVQKFKADNNIVDTTRGLMSEQQLSDVNGQLITARATTAEAKARLDRVTEISKGDVVNATVADALRSEVITRLRSQYLDLSSRYADLSSRYGKDHQAVVNIRNQMNEIQRSAREELGRVAESTKSDYEIAMAREASIQASLQKLVTQAGETSKKQVELRDLESSAQTYRNLYDNFLQKFEETTQEQTFPVNNARIISPAPLPDRPSWPKAPIVLGGMAVLGLGLGFAVALFREVLGNGFRTPDDVKNYAGVECLGVLPSIAREVGRVTKGAGAAVPGRPGEEILGSMSPIARHVVLAPFSRFTETVRNFKVSLDIARTNDDGLVTGIISSVPHEGKTTFAANLALLTAQMGHRTLLIDGDMHSPSLTKALCPDAKVGLIEFLEGKATIGNIVRRDVITGLEFVPTVVKERKPNTVSHLTGETMVDFLAAARRQYEYVFIDMPPVVPVVDVKASAHQFDAFVFVIEWGRTSRDVVRDAMVSAEQVRQRIVGAVLNKADPTELKRLESYRGAAYGSYYIEHDS